MASSDLHQPLMQHDDQNMALMSSAVCMVLHCPALFGNLWVQSTKFMRQDPETEQVELLVLRIAVLSFLSNWTIFTGFWLKSNIHWHWANSQVPVSQDALPASSTQAVWQTAFRPQVFMAPQWVSLRPEGHLQQQQQPGAEERWLVYITFSVLTIKGVFDLKASHP